MSLALMIGAVIAYPMNWWLVAHHLKHGMMTVRRPGSPSMPAKMDMAASPEIKINESYWWDIEIERTNPRLNVEFLGVGMRYLAQ